MKVKLAATWEFLQHTGTPQVFACGVHANAPDELLNDPGFMFQLEHGKIEIIEPVEQEAPKHVIGLERENKPTFEPIVSPAPTAKEAPKPVAKKGKK